MAIHWTKFCIFASLSIFLVSADTESSFNVHNVFLSDFLSKRINNHAKVQARTYDDCLSDISKWQDGVRNGESWAFKMLDAQGIFPNGLFSGNRYELGHSSQCLGIEHEVENQYPIFGKYCVVRMHPNISSGETTRKIDRSTAIIFNSAMCVPRSCNASQLNDFFADELIKFDDDRCLPHASEKWVAGDWIALIIFIDFIVLVLASTLADLLSRHYLKDRLPWHSILISFSIYTNTANLMRSNSNERYALKCINGIRVLSMLWVILGNQYAAYRVFPMLNQSDITAWIQSAGGLIVLGSTLATDTFFILSGMLLAYIFFRKMEKSENFNILQFYLHRFLRLTPVLGAMIFFKATLYRHLATGPMWNELNKPSIENCQSYWWTSLLYVQNYVNPLNLCLSQSWYLSVDMQLFILSPLLLYTLLRKKIIGLANLAFWTIISFITCTIIVFINDWPAAPIPLTSDQTTIDSYLIGYYYATHMRATPWLLGFAGGYLLYQTSKTDNEYNKWFVTALWVLSLGIMAAVIFGAIPLQDIEHVVNKGEDGTYNAFARLGWSLSVIWMIIACVHGYGGCINWFLSFEIWEVLAKLSYCAYILNQSIIYLTLMSSKSSLAFSELTVWNNFLGNVLLIFGVAYIWSMTFEAPFVALEKALKVKKEKPEPEKKKSPLTYKESRA